MLEWKGQSEGCWGEKEGEGDWRRRQERQSSRKRKQTWKWRGSPRYPPGQPLPDPDTCWPDALTRGIGVTGQPDSRVDLHIPRRVSQRRITEATSETKPQVSRSDPRQVSDLTGEASVNTNIRGVRQ